MELRTMDDILKVLSPLDRNQQLTWLQGLGEYLTISARASYDDEKALAQLRGFNELQHWVYGRMRDLQNDHDWPLNEFLSDCLLRARHYGVEGGFGWALRSSLKPLQMPGPLV